MYKTTDDPAKILDVVDSYCTDYPIISPRKQEYFSILENTEDERPIQRFFEQNPDIFVGSKYVVANALISKLPLGNDFVTDFAFVEPTSGFTYLYLIEIESPKIKIFNADDHFSTKYNRAFQQVQDWTNWAGRNLNAMRELFIPLYKMSNEGSVPPMFILKCYLIAGRRSEFSNVRRQERFQTRCGQMTGGIFTVRTYDGFAESNDWILRTDRHDHIKCFSYRNRSFVAYLRVFRGVSKFNLPGSVGFFQFLRNFRQHNAFEQAELILQAALDPAIARRARRGEFVAYFDHFDLLQTAIN